MRNAAPILAICLLFSACGETPPEPSPADVEARAEGVGTESQVRFFILEELKLTSLDLTHTGAGNYTGSGVAADGTNYQVEVEQHPGGLNYSWTTPTGKKGTGTFGTPANDSP